MPAVGLLDGGEEGAGVSDLLDHEADHLRGGIVGQRGEVVGEAADRLVARGDGEADPELAFLGRRERRPHQEAALRDDGDPAGVEAHPAPREQVDAERHVLEAAAVRPHHGEGASSRGHEPRLQ